MKGALPGLPSRGGADGTGSRMARAPRDDAERRCGSGARRDGGSAGESLGQQRTRRRSGPLGGRKLGGPGPAESRPELRGAGSACLQGHGASTRGEATSRGAGEGEAPQAVRPGRPMRMQHPPQGARDSGRLRGAGGRREARGETLKRREDRSVDSCDPTRVLRSAGRDHRRHPRGRSGGVAGAPAGGGCLPGGGGRGGESRRPWNPTETHGCRATSGEFGSLSGEILRHSGASPTWRTWPLSSHRSATLTPACRRSRTRWTPSKRRYVALAAACVGRPRPTPRWFWKVLSVDCSSPGLTCGVRR